LRTELSRRLPIISVLPDGFFWGGLFVLVVAFSLCGEVSLPVSPSLDSGGVFCGLFFFVWLFFLFFCVAVLDVCGFVFFFWFFSIFFVFFLWFPVGFFLLGLCWVVLFFLVFFFCFFGASERSVL